MHISARKDIMKACQSMEDIKSHVNILYLFCSILSKFIGEKKTKLIKQRTVLDVYNCK